MPEIYSEDQAHAAKLQAALERPCPLPRIRWRA
jgi:hypothetical protein